MHVNKVSHVTTTDRGAKDLGERQEWLFHIFCEMDTEDGVIWIRGLGEDVVMAFTDFGIETLTELIKSTKQSDAPEALSPADSPTAKPAAYDGWLPFKFFMMRR